MRQAAGAAIARETQDVFVPMSDFNNGRPLSRLQEEKTIVPPRLKLQVNGDGIVRIHVAMGDKRLVPNL